MKGISVFVLYFKNKPLIRVTLTKSSIRIKLCLYVVYVFILTAFGFSNYPSLSNRLSVFLSVLFFQPLFF
ncbi:hypothetical protein BD560DRAFT_389393 [Blakeslea trispora]|nr:hypothetical protein BD560DRAFT_389393 [Blakeslea trispora]